MATVDGYDQTDRWRYVVLMSKFFHQFIQQGFFKSFGVLIPSMVVQLNCSYSVAGFISSLFYTSTWVFCPLARFLSTKFGCRKTSVVGGSVVGVCVSCLFFVRIPALIGLLLIIAGIGNSFLAQTGYVVLQENFGEQFGAANAVASLGLSFGALTFPLLSHTLVKTYGIWGTFLIFGSMMAHFIPIGATYRSPRPAASGKVDDNDLPISPDIEGSSGPSDLFIGESRSIDTPFQHLPTDERKDYAYQVLSREAERDEGETENENEKEQEKKPDKHIEAMSSSTSPSSCLAIYRYFKSVCVLIVKTLALDDLWQEKEFSLFLIPCQMLADMIFAGWSLFVISYGLSLGINPDTAPYLLVAGVAGSFLSRGLSVVLLRTDQERALGLYVFFYVALISGLFSYPLHSSFAYLIFCSTLTGFGIFGIYTTFYAVLNVSVSGDHFSGILAATFCIFGVMMSFSSIIAGRIFDITQSLKTMFMIYGGFGCVGAILIFTFIYRRRRNTSSSI